MQDANAASAGWPRKPDHDCQFSRMKVVAGRVMKRADQDHWPQITAFSSEPDATSLESALAKDIRTLDSGH